MKCQLVDETGMVTAFFDKHMNYLKESYVYQIDHLKCKVVDNHLMVVMRQNTTITKEPGSLSFKDKSVDVS